MAAGETATFAVWGSNGSCTIPNTATGIASNITAIGATQPTYLTVFPAEAGQPTTSNLNPAPGQPPTPNQVTVGLSATGATKVFNFSGTLDLLIDIVGYYLPAGGATPPPPGPPTVVVNSITFTGLTASFNPGLIEFDLVHGCASFSGNVGELFVPLPIPNGSTIVAVQIRSFSGRAAPGNNQGAAKYELFAVNQGFPGTLVASFQSVPGLIDTPMVFAPQSAVGLGNSFFVKATLINGYTTQQLCAVTVDYTM